LEKHSDVNVASTATTAPVPSNDAGAAHNPSHNAGAAHNFDFVKGEMTDTESVPVDSLLPADSPRIEGEDLEHIRMLAATETKFPPIIVHRATMRVVDGMHRLAATKLRNETMIEVRYFSGTEQEAFVLAVKANIIHGRPLSASDRSEAAVRIIVSHPDWSDRAVAAVAGISARLVANLRQRLDLDVDSLGRRARIGRDGRMRPLDSAEGRLKAAEIIRQFPQASLREVGQRAGISPATAGDVRKRIQRGDQAVAGRRERAERPAPHKPVRPAGTRDVPDLGAILDGLKADPSLRFTETGREILRWIMSKALHPGEWRAISEGLPPHATYILADVARRCSDEWRHIANDLDQRLRHMPTRGAVLTSAGPESRDRGVS
jgi:hypothetical protein